MTKKDIEKKNRLDMIKEVEQMGYEVRYQELGIYPVIDKNGVQIGCFVSSYDLDRFIVYSCHVETPNNIKEYCEENFIDINTFGQMEYNEWKEYSEMKGWL